METHEGRAVVAPGMLQNPSVKTWLAGVEPAWTLLDQASFTALYEPPRRWPARFGLPLILRKQRPSNQPSHETPCSFCELPRQSPD
jgi:hypothetical protein